MLVQARTSRIKTVIPRTDDMARRFGCLHRDEAPSMGTPPYLLRQLMHLETDLITWFTLRGRVQQSPLRRTLVNHRRRTQDDPAFPST